jgi:membrane-associated protein
MHYYKYILYCISGAILWVTSITFLGYFLGQVPWVKDNFEKVVLFIILISVLPIFIKIAKNKLKKK